MAVACARNPVSGRPEPVVVSGNREVEIGQEETAKVEKYMGFVRKPALVRYVRAIGERLAKQSPRQDVNYHFYVVDELEPNAFALPGGYVFVTRGLLALTNSEDELACVIGHEIGHVAARHSVRRATLGSPFTLVTAIPGKVIGLVLPDLGESIAGSGQLVSGLILAPYSRHQERQADRLGQQLAARAGWNPAALSTFLYTLTRDTELALGRPRRTRFFDSHPGTPQRVHTTEGNAMQIGYDPKPPIAPNRDAFLYELGGLRVGPSAEEGVFVENLFLHPVFDFKLRFPENWEPQNAKTYVAAAIPNQEVFVMLELFGEGDDPVKAAGLFEEATKIRLLGDPEPLSIGGLRAARSSAERRRRGLDLTWIAHAGKIYQVTGVSPRLEFDTHRDRFEAVARSFRPLTPADRAKIMEKRLRIIRSERGETVEAFLGRTGGAWSVDKVTVANALWPGKPLGDRLVKVAMEEPYIPMPRDDASLD
jgi:predicted Zn-dependent protease